MVNLITDDRYCSILVITVSNIFTLQKHEHTLKKYYCQPSSLSLNKIISSRELCSCHHYWMYLIWICHCIKYNLLFQLILIFFSSTNFFLPQSVLYSFQLIVPYLNPMRLLLFSFLLLNEKKNSWKSKGKSSSFQFTAFEFRTWIVHSEPILPCFKGCNIKWNSVLFKMMGNIEFRIKDHFHIRYQRSLLFGLSRSILKVYL